MPKQTLGMLYAVLAYGSWGLVPLYWKLFPKTIAAPEILSHRMLWSAVLLALILTLQTRLGEVQTYLRSPLLLRTLLLTASLLACNWGLYIYAVNSDRIIETSLGYFINPLINVLLGVVILKEKLHGGQAIAVGIATLGVLTFALGLGHIPWIALSLAFTFGLYGLLRKITPVSPLPGLLVETLLLVPLGLAYLTWLQTQGTPGQPANHFNQSPQLTLLFIGCGLITSLPLIWFTNAAQRLHLSTLGFFQYLAPSLQLALAVFLYDEPFTPKHALTFGLIWLALGLYSSTAWVKRATP
jgi:chloramphenicol-sensitive protein RarD